MKSEFIEKEEFVSLLSETSEITKLALLVSLETGLRISDVLHSTYAALLWGQPLVEAKTGKMVVVSLPAYLKDAILSRFARAGEGVTAETLAFPGRKPGKPVSRSTVYRQLRRAAACASAHVTPHTARKIYAVEAYRALKDVEKVRKLLRHDRVDTTLLYAFSDVLQHFPD